MIDTDNITEEEQMLLSFIRFKKKSIGDFINSKACTTVANKRREVLNNYKPTIASKGSAPAGAVSLKGISLDNIRH